VRNISSVELSASADKTRKRKRKAFSSVSLPTPLVERVQEVVSKVGYWPTKAAFMREACLEKLDKYKKEEWSRRR
jgi:Arc/MetJ-type ribon-helix-helix transcriptional regulator